MPSMFTALKIDENGRTLRAKMETRWKAGNMLRRGLWWRIWFKRCAGRLFIGQHVTIRDPQYISVGYDFIAEDFCELQGLSKEGLVFGNRVSIGRFAMIRPTGYYGREIGIGLKVGDHSNIGPYCFVGCSGRIEIGDSVLMGPRVSLIAENHNYGRIDVPMKAQGVTREAIVIEDDCWLGADSVILAGTHIGRSAIVAAGAVVNKEVPQYAIVGGVPARVIGWREATASPAGTLS
jgi:acetyltransferase-like isoleucine patch superfamily enzyme